MNWRNRLAVVALALLPFATFHRLWLTGPRAQHLWGDSYGLYWPDLVFLHRALTHWQAPLWNPFERGGVSMLSEPEAGVLDATPTLRWLYESAPPFRLFRICSRYVTRDGPFDPRSALVSDAWVAKMQQDADTHRIFAEFGLPWRAGTRLGLRDLRSSPSSMCDGCSIRPIPSTA